MAIEKEKTSPCLDESDPPLCVKKLLLPKHGENTWDVTILANVRNKFHVLPVPQHYVKYITISAVVRRAPCKSITNGDTPISANTATDCSQGLKVLFAYFQISAYAFLLAALSLSEMLQSP